jgi:hypothetical protein
MGGGQNGGEPPLRFKNSKLKLAGPGNLNQANKRQSVHVIKMMKMGRSHTGL